MKTPSEGQLNIFRDYIRSFMEFSEEEWSISMNNFLDMMVLDKYSKKQRALWLGDPANELMLRILGLFNPVVKGSIEMYNQQKYDYHFDSSKFEKAFRIAPVAYETGIRALAETFYKTKRL